MDIKHIKWSKHAFRWIKKNSLRPVIVIALLFLGSIIGASFISIKDNSITNSWVIGITTGIITSLCVAVFLDTANKRTQEKRDTAIKKAVLLSFINKVINQSLHMMAWKYPLYHHACDIDYMKEFVNEKVKSLNEDCVSTIRYYSAFMNKDEFNALDIMKLMSQQLIQFIDGISFSQMAVKKEDYNLYYNYLGHEVEALTRFPPEEYNEIKENVQYEYSILRHYLNALENAIFVFDYIFDDNISYQNLHKEITQMDKRYKDMFCKN